MMKSLPARLLCAAAPAASLDLRALALLTITELKARAATNDPVSCFELAFRHKSGLPLGKPEEDLSAPKDIAEAQRWFQKAYDLALPAAKKGDHQFQNMLGRICLEGLDDTNRLAEGVAWRRKAARGGNIHAQVDLGRALLDGHWELHRNDEEAVKWLSKAAARQHRVAVSRLVQFYSAKKEYKSAAKWLHMLAEFGEREGQSELGQWYAQGIGVRKDNVEAYKWLSLAAVPRFNTNRAGLRAEWRERMAREEQKHALRRDVHGALLTPDQVQRAKQKVAAFERTKTFHEETKNP